MSVQSLQVAVFLYCVCHVVIVVVDNMDSQDSIFKLVPYHSPSVTSSSYPHFVLTSLSFYSFYPHFTLILPSFYPHFTLILLFLP